MRKKTLDRRGFTLAEVAIAMAIIAVVTAVAVAIALSALRSSRRAVYLSQARYFSSDVLEAFRSANDSESFEAAMEFVGGYSSVEKRGETFIYELDNSGYTATIAVDTGDIDDKESKLTLIITDDKNNEILNRTFRKGASE